MADNLPISPGSGALVATDQDTSDGAHISLVKLASGTAGDRTLLPASPSLGLMVEVSQVNGSVSVLTTGTQKVSVDGSSVNQPVINATSTALAVAAPVAAPISVRVSNGSSNIDTLPVTVENGSIAVTGTVALSGTPAVEQSGTWNIGALNSITDAVTVTGTVALSGTSPVSGTVAANQGAAASASGAWMAKITDGTNVAGSLTSVAGSYALKVDVVKQVGGGFSQADGTSFTAGTTPNEVDGGVFNDGLGAVASGNSAAQRITAYRAGHVNLRNNGGVEIGTSSNPVRIDPVGTTTQPVSGTVAVTQSSGNWNDNLTQVGGHSVTTVANGTQQVGISDGNGNDFTQQNPLQTQNAPSGGTGGATQIPWKQHMQVTSGQTAIAIHTPASGKTSYIEGIVIAISAVSGGGLWIFDNSDSDSNALWSVKTAWQYLNQVITPSRPIPLSAVNNVLRYTSSTGTVADITVWGFEA